MTGRLRITGLDMKVDVELDGVEHIGRFELFETGLVEQPGVVLGNGDDVFTIGNDLLPNMTPRDSNVRVSGGGGRDTIDVQSFIWVIATYEGDSDVG